MTDINLAPWVAVWLAAMIFVVGQEARYSRGAGLILAYVMQLFALHWLAAAIYLLPWYWQFELPIVFAGLKQSTYALAGLMVGTTILVPLLTRHRRDVDLEPIGPMIVDQSLVKLYLGLGLLSYFVLLPILGRIPTITAIVAAAGSLTVLGLGLACWNAHQRGGRRLWTWIAVSALLPFATIALQGFLGYGFAAMVMVFSFVASFYRPRWKIAAFALAVGYVGMSFYVTYMRDRGEIRDVVWTGASMSARLEQLRDTFSEPELFDIQNVDHLHRVDQRLNQNYLVGSAVAYLRTREELFARGETIWHAIISPIPRAIWPNKPIVAGSGDLVSKYTGIMFAEGTSVGIGPVMEMYVNFGSPGVFIGFVLIGLFLGYVDMRAGECRDRGDWLQFTVWFLPGLGMVQVGGSLVELTASAAAAWLVAVGLTRTAIAKRAIGTLEIDEDDGEAVQELTGTY